jgi:tetratricopeptide (TPR) repeat protein
MKEFAHKTFLTAEMQFCQTGKVDSLICLSKEEKFVINKNHIQSLHYAEINHNSLIEIQSLNSIGRFDEAILKLNEILKSEPDYQILIDLYTEHLRAFVGLNRYPEVIELGLAYLKHCKDDELGRLNIMSISQMIGQAYYFQEKYTKAIHYLEKAVLLSKEFIMASAGFVACCFLTLSYYKVNNTIKQKVAMMEVDNRVRSSIDNKDIYIDRMYQSTRLKFLMGDTSKNNLELSLFLALMLNNDFDINNVTEMIKDKIDVGIQEKYINKTYKAVYIPEIQFIITCERDIISIKENDLYEKIILLCAGDPVSVSLFSQKIWGRDYDPVLTEPSLRATLSKVRKKLSPAVDVEYKDKSIKINNLKVMS